MTDKLCIILLAALALIIAGPYALPLALVSLIAVIAFEGIVREGRS